ncbi:fatty acyl-CoA synthetase [Enteractinococcus coprophilus]|uniref:Fatty-acyl-CoA synthase n=1 Tax=Enteractinococcus coprophilus TaxID=1027633 RepID=A0A543AF38_9MICC|nr:fatty acyl-CoA synthetase [Enteractinococcus coprophilus]TQL71192.1 fatty-acyl-CoA synthase [Enteractinococcus coprophilus]
MNTNGTTNRSIEEDIKASQRNSVSLQLARVAATQRDHVALKYQERTWTYTTFNQAVTVAALRLRELGLQQGDRVAVMGKNSDTFLILFFAASRAGLVHVPINFALTGPELHYLVSDSEASVLIADDEYLEAVESITDSSPLDQVVAMSSIVEHIQTILENNPALSAALIEDDLDTAEETDLVQLLYTSGTTSAPKGAMLTHRALLAHYNGAIPALDMTRTDNPLIAMPLYHSAALHVFITPYLFLGATIRLLRVPDIAEMLRRIEDERIGSLFLAPTVWVPLSQHPDLATRDLSSLKKAQYGASIMPVTVLQRLREQYPNIGFYNCFGQSEMSPLCTVLRPEEHAQRPASAGRPIPTVELRVADSTTGLSVPPGTPGEVQYRSPQLFSGYWKKPEQTQDAFIDGWFRSGDLVTMDDHGYIEVVDRIKDVINSGGELVASREVEDVLYRHQAVAEVAVVGRPHAKWIEQVTAVVVLKEGHPEVSAKEIRDFSRQYLARHKVPGHIEFVTELPRNQSGKLLKRELK